MIGQYFNFVRVLGGQVKVAGWFRPSLSAEVSGKPRSSHLLNVGKYSVCP